MQQRRDSYFVISWHLATVSYDAGTLLQQGLILTPIAPLRRHRVATVLRDDAVPILIVVVFSLLSYILVLTVMLRAPVALVAPLRELSIVIGAFLACWIFCEGHLVRRIAGAVIVLAGIAATSL